jgi:hypothetical protein
LRTVLANSPVPVKDIEREAIEACLLVEGKSVGHSKPFRDARKVLGVRSVKAGMAKGWVWALPKVPSIAEGAPAKTEGTFQQAGHLHDRSRDTNGAGAADKDAEGIPSFLRRRPPSGA